jgi:prepilin-type N-terminal cleavage/methylation domain-containing protein
MILPFGMTLATYKGDVRKEKIMKKNDKGFSLLEVVVSMMIFAVLVPGVFTMAIYAKSVRCRTQNVLQAAYQAQTVMERSRYMSTDDFFGTSRVLSTGDTHSPNELSLSDNPDISNAISPEWYYNVTTVSGFKKGTITVRWQEKFGG